MELGQRLKQARLEAGLSQRQLCGEEITRNMLSQIENGSARPSMQTLGYLAGRLGKSISYFLEEDAVRSPNQQQLLQARKAFREEDWQAVLQILQDYRAPDEIFDPERYLLEALSLMGRAGQALAEEKKVYAQNLLEKARQAGEQTPYYSSGMERERLLLMSLAHTGQASELARQLPEDHREQYLRAEAALEEGAFDRCVALLESMPEDTPRWHYLRAQAAAGHREHSLAAEHYLLAEAAYPRACAKALEDCYRELGDYKNAYLYACKLRQLEQL